MDASKKTLKKIFGGNQRFLIPVYQRYYVWDLDKQWRPLWEDIEATARRLAEQRVDAHQKGWPSAQADENAAPHFLGAIVVQSIAGAIGGGESWEVVDGQQRLTTLQVLLRGVLDALEDVSAERKLQVALHRVILNDDELLPPDELLKIQPGKAEEATEFAVTMGSERLDASVSSFAHARHYFSSEARRFLLDPEIPPDPYVDAVAPEHGRTGVLVDTLLGLVQMVGIELGIREDAQVIFEALNARGEPLSASDLVKNYLLMRAKTEFQDPEEIYEKCWKRFDDQRKWWSATVGTGSHQRIRQDWVLGDWLVNELSRSIQVGRLYDEFRNHFLDGKLKAYDVLAHLSAFATAYEHLNDRGGDLTDTERTAYQRLMRLNVMTATPVLLALLVLPPDQLPRPERELAFRAIESYAVRRMAAKGSSRSYGPVFVEVLKAAQDAGSHPGLAVIKKLASKPLGQEWPTSSDLLEAFKSERYYGGGGLTQDRLRLLLGAIDAKLQREHIKGEVPEFDYQRLQIEHVIPQGWREYWPVTITGVTARAVAEQERAEHINRIGNLTLTTAPLNNSMSNDPWGAKRRALRAHSKLELNEYLLNVHAWDEREISLRSEYLADQVDQIWPGPDAGVWAQGAAGPSRE